MKRIVQVIFTVFTFFILTNFVSASSVKVSITGDQVFTKEITLNVQVSNIIDFKGTCNGVCSLTGVLYYNQEQLELVEIKPLNNFHNESEEDFLLSFDRNNGVLSTTNIFSIKFKSKNMYNAELSEISITDMKVGNGKDTIDVKDAKLKIIYQAPDAADIKEEDIKEIIGEKTENEGGSSTTVKSSNSNLKSIELSSGHIDLIKNSVSYEIEVDNSVENITISGQTEDENATVEGFGEKTLVIGENNFTIVVTAENGNKTTYILKINRLEKSSGSSEKPNQPDDNNPTIDNKPNEENPKDASISKKTKSILVIVMGSLAGVIIVAVVAIVIIVRKNGKDFK